MYFGIEAAAQAAGVLLQCALMYRIHVRTRCHAALSAYAGLARSFVRASCNGAQARRLSARAGLRIAMVCGTERRRVPVLCRARPRRG